MTSETSATPIELLDSLRVDLDSMWLLLGAILVFFMQTGFAMLEVGSVSIKNTKNILIKNIGDASIGSICWWLLGYGIAFGEDSGGFIGTDSFALKGSTFRDEGVFNSYSYASWLFQWAFAATAATIVSGAVAERVSFDAYVVYSIVLTCFIYPVVVHWGWSGDGWASPWSDDIDSRLFDCGTIDFAGSGVVHMTGGVAALCAAVFVGPRKGRFNEDGTANTLPQQSAVLQTLGTLILWFGWYGFNGASTLYIVDFAGVAAKTMVTTTIAAGSGAITTVIITKVMSHYYDAGAANNGVLAGLVGITAGCSTCEPEGAFVIGVIAGFVYVAFSKALVMLKIDDVVDAIPVHFGCGMWGVFAAGLFATKENYSEAYYGDRAEDCAGAFYGGNGNTLAANVVFILAIIAWVGATCCVLFSVLYFTVGVRVPPEMEEAVNWVRRGWYGGQAVGGQKAKAPVDCKKLVEHSIKKMDEAIKRDDFLIGSVEGGLDNILSSCKVSLDSGLEDLETGDEVQILQEVGMDESKHGGRTYPELVKGFPTSDPIPEEAKTKAETA